MVLEFQLRLLFVVGMAISKAFAASYSSSPSALSNETSTRIEFATCLLALAALSTLIAGGILAGKSLQNKRKHRNPLKLVGLWWKRRRQGYIRQDDTQEESVLTEVHSYYPPPTFSLTSSTSDEAAEEDVSLATKSVYYENSPMLPPRPDDESLISDTCTYIPPPDMIPPSEVPKNRTRSFHCNDNGSFHSSLESLDSLVESYWDPDDESQLSLVPIEMNPSAVIEEHIQFLRHQAKAATRKELRKMGKHKNGDRASKY